MGDGWREAFLSAGTDGLPLVTGRETEAATLALPPQASWPGSTSGLHPSPGLLLWGGRAPMPVSGAPTVRFFCSSWVNLTQPGPRPSHACGMEAPGEQLKRCPPPPAFFPAPLASPLFPQLHPGCTGFPHQPAFVPQACPLMSLLYFSGSLSSFGKG